MKIYLCVFGTWTSTVLVLSFIYAVSTVSASSVRFSPYQMEMAPTSAERPFSVKLLNLIQRRVGKNARMDTESPDSMSLLKSTGSILKSLVKMAAAASESQPTMRMERKSSRFFPTSESTSSHTNNQEGRPVRRIRKSRVLFPTDDGSFSTNNNFDNSLSNDNSNKRDRLPIWPQTLQSRQNEQRPNNFRQGIITRVSRPSQNEGVRQEDLITRLTNPMLYKSSYLVPSSSREGEVVAVKPLPPSVIRSQPLTVEIGPGTTRDGRKLKTVEVQGVKIIIGEPRLNDPYDKYFKFNPSTSLN